MTSSVHTAHVPAERPREAPQTQALTPSQIAWLAMIPTALVTVLAIALLGPPLGNTLLPPDAFERWPSAAESFFPEPNEQGRFLVSLLAPLLLSGLTILGVRRAPRLEPSTASALVTVAQGAGAAFVVVCVIAQRAFLYGYPYAVETPAFHRTYFTLVTLVVAAVLAAGVVIAIRDDSARARVTRWLADTRTRRLVVGGIAAAATVIWLLHAFNTASTIVNAHPAVVYHIEFPLNETFAVLNGRSPLVDFASQYGSLWPYALAAVMSVLGETLGVFSALTLIVTGLAMLAMYAVLRRVARSPLGGLLLFLPFLASSFFVLQGPLENRYTFGTLAGSFPLRYAGPFLLAWLLARHLDGARPRRAWLLFLVAGLVVLNNADAGVPAFGATIAALLWAGGRPTPASLGRLALAIAAGSLLALALVSALTLARTGSLPQLELLLRFSRLFAAAGFGMLPMPTLGLHTVIYLTFVAAIGTATVRAITQRADDDRLLTGMLAFSGVFGLGAGAYYVGRSHPESLVATFGTWSFALALLAVVAVRTLAGAPARRPSLAQLAVLFGMGVAACSLAQTPLPWQQIERLSRTTDPEVSAPIGRPMVERHVEPGERVAILMPMGNRLAEEVGVVNVSPYGGSQSIWLPVQVDELLAALRENDARKVFLWREDTRPELQLSLAGAGFDLRDQDDEAMQLWVRRGAR